MEKVVYNPTTGTSEIINVASHVTPTSKIDILNKVVIGIDVEHATDEEIIGYAFYVAQFKDNKKGSHVEEFKYLIDMGLVEMIRNMFDFVEGYKDYTVNNTNIMISKDRCKKGLKYYNKYFV
jgi:hypothetical protein